MPVEDTLRDQMLAAVPSLRAFATFLTGNRDRADDLVQDTLMRAWANIDRFKRAQTLRHGSSPSYATASIPSIASADARWRMRTGSYSARLKTLPDQHARLDYEDFLTALAKLLPDQREALLLVGAQGMSYEEAAAICNVPLGTIKSRVNRARSRLADLLDINSEAEIGPDAVTKAALAVE
jgi:RNA polymerase sigma-70 factor (ECF subfamily)